MNLPGLTDHEATEQIDTRERFSYIQSWNQLQFNRLCGLRKAKNLRRRN